jgi:hypothetical protein
VELGEQALRVSPLGFVGGERYARGAKKQAMTGTVGMKRLARLVTGPVLAAALASGCGAGPRGRPTLPPPEYEDPATPTATPTSTPTSTSTSTPTTTTTSTP